jgi:predicted acylesterase/phospholipase RssA
VEDRGTPKLECDIIMKGGITSGIVYPLAAVHLSKTHRFRRVGGASAGAIAAAFVAAAEKGRAAGGFERIAELPEELGAELHFLFQPSASTKPGYEMLMALVEPTRSPLAKLARGIWIPLRSRWKLAVAVFGTAMVPGFALALGLDGRSGGPIDWGNVVQMAALWAPLAAVASVAAALIRTAQTTVSALAANGFGLCDGHTTAFAGHQPLTDWMTSKLDQVAGIADGAGPLTFGDLWGPTGIATFDGAVPVGASVLELKPREQRELRAERDIDLEVMTTNLSLCRPYRFPFESRIFFFCSDCFARYFPAGVVKQMMSHSDAVPDKPWQWTDDAGSAHQKTISMLCPLHPGTRTRHFPRPADVPVVVAARLSLSFPALISAVPMCYVDYSRSPEYVELVTVWFSDGGIASNFPMHLFDSIWPIRPTFGIDLQPLDVEHGEQLTYLPTRGEARSHPIASMLSFGHSILNTMQNWVDTTQLTLPAYRKRVAEIRLAPQEGGMNLRMPAKVITTIAGRGGEAAALFDDFSLAEHQRSRFETSMAMIDDLLAGLNASTAAGFEAVVTDSSPGERVAAARQLLAQATQWENTDHPATHGNLPHPNPELRLVPRQ